MEHNYKRLVRSRTNRSISGVCGGIGEYLGLDPSVIRLIWIICSFGTIGMGALIYFIAAIVIPES